MQTKKPKRGFSPIEDEDQVNITDVTDDSYLDEDEDDNEDTDVDYISLENDYVRVYSKVKEILPGVRVDVRTFKVFLTEDKESFLEFKEPNTQQSLDMVSTTAKKATPDKILKFAAMLSCGKIKATVELLKLLPAIVQYRIIRTIGYLNGSPIGGGDDLDSLV